MRAGRSTTVNRVGPSFANRVDMLTANSSPNGETMPVVENGSIITLLPRGAEARVSMIKFTVWSANALTSAGSLVSCADTPDARKRKKHKTTTTIRLIGDLPSQFSTSQPLRQSGYAKAHATRKRYHKMGHLPYSTRHLQNEARPV